MLGVVGEVLAPRRCGGCGDALPPGARVAPGPAAAWCVHCRDRWGGSPGWWATGGSGCAGWAAAAYRGPVRRAVLTAKRGAPQAAARLLVARLPVSELPPDAVVTWVPGHPLRTWAAPDAGEALARAVAEAMGERPARALLSRSPLGRRQARRSTEGRRADPARLGLRVAAAVPGAVVLVDDVRTTGTTLDRAAALLRAAGAREVVAVAVAAVAAELDR